MKCPYCGRDVIYSDRFCKCGAELDMVVCPNCGTPNITLATFCGNCGHILAGAEPFVPEPEEVEAEEPEEAGIPEQEPAEEVIPEPEPEEEVTPEPEPEEVTTPKPEPVEEVTPEPESVEEVTPEPEPVEEVTPEPESVEEVAPEPEPEEPAVPEEEPEASAVSEPEEPVVPEEETEEAAVSEPEPEEPVVPEEKPEEVTEELTEETVPEETTEELTDEAVPEETTEELTEEAVPEEATEELTEETVPEETTEELTEETVPEEEPEEGGGGKRRRGGLIALWIVIAIIVVVVIVLLVWATRGNREESTPVENEENLTNTEAGTDKDLTADQNADEEETPATVSDVSFDRKTTEDNQEYAVVTATDEAGNVVWEYTTPQYAEAELDRVSDIGLHGNSYFLIQDGAVLSLDKSTGDTLWENGDYGGTPVDHSWDYAADGLYLCGYDGPAIYGVSYDGDTLGKIDAFDNLTDVTETNLWPYKVFVSGREATVLYGPENVLEEGDTAITENEATVYSVNLDTWEYNLVSNGAAKVESTAGNNDNGSNNGSGSDNGSGSGSNGGSDSSGDSGSGGSGSGSNGGSGSGSGSGSNGGSNSGGGSGSSGGSGSGSGSGDNGGSGSGSGSGNSGSGSGTQSSTPKVNMSDVKDVTASSYLYERNVNISHDPKYLVDGTLKNAWCEDASGDGIGQWAKVEFNGTYTVSGMNINAGYQKSESLYYQNCRPKEITITFSDGSSFDTTLEDVNKEQNVSFSKPVNTSSVTITIRSVYKGSKYEDTCISEVAFY